MTSPSTELPDAVGETLAWQVLAELIRRHPQRLWIETGTHDIGTEQAFILDVDHAEPRLLGYFGLPGSNATALADTSGPANWRDFYRRDDPRDWLLEFERAMGLAPPNAGLPASTPRSLAVRWAGAFLRSQVSGRHRWVAGGGHRWGASHSVGHSLIPRGARWTGDDYASTPLTPLCLGIEDDHPQFAVTPSGDLYGMDGLIGNLQERHVPGGSMSGLLHQTVPGHLP